MYYLRSALEENKFLPISFDLCIIIFFLHGWSFLSQVCFICLKLMPTNLMENSGKSAGLLFINSTFPDSPAERWLYHLSSITQKGPQWSESLSYQKKDGHAYFVLVCFYYCLTLIHICGVRADPRKLPQVHTRLLSESQNQEST